MDKLIHRTNCILHELHGYFVQLEKCDHDQVQLVENQIKSKLDDVRSNCQELDIMVNKEPPQRRTAARVQVEQLKYDCRHYHASLSNVMQRRIAKENELREREELLTRRFTTNDGDTSILIDQSLLHNKSLHNVHRNMDELLDGGSNVLENLREQKGTLKGAHKKILDVANTLGLSNTVMRLIEKRTYQDKFVLIGGMVVTCLIMFLIYKYLT